MFRHLNFRFPIFILLISLNPFWIFSQPVIKKWSEKPKLVVGLVVDQMRYDYLTRYWEDYGEGGFKRLINEGFLYKNAHYNYVPTFTGPGHASVYTGATPSEHGIISNYWFEKVERKQVYCVQDDNVSTVGSDSKAGKMSPVRMKSTAITDELKLASNHRSKVIGISLKDRGSILPAGHKPDGAYWFDGKTGHWITSTYYSKDLPDWVESFNSNGKVSQYVKQGWNLMIAKEKYDESISDSNRYEGSFAGNASPTFPHVIASPMGSELPFEVMKAIPAGNSLSVDFALEALVHEKLGKDEFTDILALSFSATDYVGHQFGPASVESQDAYLRLDKDIERLLNQLDKMVGTANYTVFLTADHGGVHVPSYLMDNQMPGGYFEEVQVGADLKKAVKTKFGLDDLILDFSNFQVFLNNEILDKNKIKRNEVQNFCKQYLIELEGVHKVITRNEIETGSSTDIHQYMIMNGFNQKASGDVIFVVESGWVSYQKTGTTHGSSFAYDTHVPIIFFGHSIKKGQSVERVSITSIASTVSQILDIQMPSGCVSAPLGEALR